MLLSITAYAQRPSFGLKAGVPISATCEAESLGGIGSANVCAQPYLIGPAVQINLLGGLSVGLAALFTRVQLQGAARPAVGPSFSTERSGAAWEFPIVPTYRMWRGPVSPFVGIGPTFRRVAMQGRNTTIPLSPLPGEPVAFAVGVGETRWDSGLCLAAGVEFRRRSLRFSPEMRYSRWSSHNPCAECGPYTLPLARSGSTVLLLGVSF
jgi:hypothetical protein